MARPSVAVVIPSYRRLERLPALVAEYLHQGADEVVVVLDGPHDGWRSALADAAGDQRVRVIELDRNRGLALARIAGLELVTADVVLITDDDVVPRPGLVDRHRGHHTELADEVLLGYMPVRLPDRRGRDQAPTYLYAREYQQQVDVWKRTDSHHRLGSLWGGNVSLPRRLYRRAEESLASQRLDYNEDLDLGLRLERLGATASFDEAAVAEHHHQRGLAAFLRECETRGRAIADLERRWGGIPPQLLPIITVPKRYNRIAGAVQRRIGAADRPGATEAVIVAAYRAAGLLRAWGVQDGLARLIRRGMAIRGYRRALGA